MKIGDEVYVHGFVDEIRKDTIIIRNDGGYFGTATNEVLEKQMQESSEDCISRQAAIEALQKEINKGIPPFDDVMGSIRCGVRLARNIIEDLPSAQPERRKD